MKTLPKDETFSLTCEICNEEYELECKGGEHSTQRARDLFRNDGWVVDGHGALRGITACPECIKKLLATD